MIATIKAEWRKNRFRPAFLVSSALLAALIVVVYLATWYQATHPGTSPREAVSILVLYPDQFVNLVMGAGYPVGAAIAIVLGALYAGSEYSWGTFKTMLTQHHGRITTWIGRVVIFELWMGIMTVVLFAAAAGSSLVVALFQGHAITWPALFDIAKASPRSGSSSPSTAHWGWRLAPSSSTRRPRSESALFTCWLSRSSW